MKHSPIEQADFGKTATDYLTYRAGFPKSVFEKLISMGIGTGNQVMVDIGTGTGTLARGFAAAGNRVTGIDPSESMLNAAREIDSGQTNYVLGTAEATGLADNFADVVAAGQCWHWFEPPAACNEIRRILKPGGQLVIAHYDWLPLKGNLVRETEKLIETHNPAWKGGNGVGVNPRIFRDVHEGGFENITSLTWDEPAVYSQEGWRGRIRASAGVSASLSEEEVKKFDEELMQLIKTRFDEEPLVVPHRVFILTASAP